MSVERADAVELYVREAGAGLPVVLLHAFPLSSAMWLDQRAALGERCHVITPDQRGFGGSSLGDAEPSLDVCADDVARLLDERGFDRVVLGGISMGGYVAMAFLRRHPGRLRGLLLADTKAGADQEEARRNRLQMAELLDAEPDAPVLLEKVLPTLIGETTVRSRVLAHGRVRGFVQSAPAYAAAWAQRAMAARPDSFEALRTVDVPALVVVGDEDDISPVSEAEAMVEALPDAELAVLPQSGHLTPLEVPEAFNEAVARFLDRLVG